jgi:hypothetical protein
MKQEKDALATKSDILELKNVLSENKAETIKWMFIFWTGQLLAMFAFLKFLVK